MSKTVVVEQAKAVASQLLELTRRLFLPNDDQVADLPLAQLRVCAILYAGPRPLSALSRELNVSLSAMTQIADRLERARLVRRVADAADRRIKSLQLTPRGERIMRQREATRIRRVLAVLAHLSPQAKQEVMAALEALVGACRAAGQSDGSNGRLKQRSA
jgi:DNA-binding MarR family transcriptional regulator